MSRDVEEGKNLVISAMPKNREDSVITGHCSQLTTSLRRVFEASAGRAVMLLRRGQYA